MKVTVGESKAFKPYKIELEVENEHDEDTLENIKNLIDSKCEEYTLMDNVCSEIELQKKLRS